MKLTKNESVMIKKGIAARHQKAVSVQSNKACVVKANESELQEIYEEAGVERPSAIKVKKVVNRNYYY